MARLSYFRVSVKRVKGVHDPPNIATLPTPTNSVVAFPLMISRPGTTQGIAGKFRRICDLQRHAKRDRIRFNLSQLPNSVISSGCGDALERDRATTVYILHRRVSGAANSSARIDVEGRTKAYMSLRGGRRGLGARHEPLTTWFVFGCAASGSGPGNSLHMDRTKNLFQQHPEGRTKNFGPFCQSSITDKAPDDKMQEGTCILSKSQPITRAVKGIQHDLAVFAIFRKTPQRFNAIIIMKSETTYNTRSGEVQAACRRQHKSPEDMSIDEICSLPKDNIGYQYLIKLFKHLEVSDILYKTANDQDMFTRAALIGRFKDAIWHGPREHNSSHVRLELDVQEARMLKGLSPLPNSFMLNTKYDAETRGLHLPRRHPDLKSWLEQHGVYTDQKSIPIIDQHKKDGKFNKPKSKPRRKVIQSSLTPRDLPSLRSSSSTSSRRSRKSNNSKSVKPDDDVPELTQEEYQERQKLAAAQADARIARSGPRSLREWAAKLDEYVPPLRSLPADWAAKLSPQEITQREQARREAIDELEVAVLAAHVEFETALDEASQAQAQVKLNKARFELKLSHAVKLFGAGGMCKLHSIIFNPALDRSPSDTNNRLQLSSSSIFEAVFHVAVVDVALWLICYLYNPGQHLSELQAPGDSTESSISVTGCKSPYDDKRLVYNTSQPLIGRKNRRCLDHGPLPGKRVKLLSVNAMLSKLRELANTKTPPHRLNSSQLHRSPRFHIAGSYSHARSRTIRLTPFQVVNGLLCPWQSAGQGEDFKPGEILGAYKARRDTFDPSTASDDHLFGLPLVHIGYDVLIELLKRHNPDKMLANIKGTAQDRAQYRALRKQDLYNRFHQTTLWFDENSENGTTSRVAVELEVQEARRARGLPPLSDAFLHTEDGDNVLRWNLLQQNYTLRYFLVSQNCNIGYPRSQVPPPKKPSTPSRQRRPISHAQQSARVATSSATQQHSPSRRRTVTTSMTTAPSFDSRAPLTIEGLTEQRNHFHQLKNDLWMEISRYDDDMPEDLIDEFHETQRQLRDTENILRLKIEEQDRRARPVAPRPRRQLGLMRERNISAAPEEEPSTRRPESMPEPPAQQPSQPLKKSHLKPLASTKNSPFQIRNDLEGRYQAFPILGLRGWEIPKEFFLCFEYRYPYAGFGVGMVMKGNTPLTKECKLPYAFRRVSWAMLLTSILEDFI
ncbi:uncharacterized protein MYCFIDRAFT_179935 [Pseudocercospora fijiensis CIRAD86]|uniref:Uncharacterized protein n=1 Tax=Pseudocercospora fijiensis (strain CIRAD86) TaxID=383855 RepID=M2ZYZ6_PSEFD|nr:uncharacterized protein MYCFIDRAFT_179935 [Pseudocercospora fijiensis CIRAD86]EME77361.1 hypothetical protein MYCFIDRAFT_179935 [Pseudocercospora fijiensis CIRAD86]